MELLKSTTFKNAILAIFPLAVIVLLFLPESASVSAAVLVALLLLWVLFFYRGSGYLFSDIPILILLLGTLSFGKAFSLLGIPVKGITLYVTEILLAASLGLLLFRVKKLWKQWPESFPRGLLAAVLIYFTFGLIYLVIGYKGNGASALRDIVFCIYILFLFVTLSLLEKPEKIRNFVSFLKPSIILLVITAVIVFFIYVPESSFRDFVKEIKMTNYGLYFGFILFFCLSFFSSSSFKSHKKRAKLTIGFVMYLALLFIVMAEVRAAWAGLLVSLIFLGIVLKKEIWIFALILVLVAGSILLIDYFDLGVQKNKLQSLGRQVETVVKYKARNMPAANIKWRLGIWKQTIEEIREFPVFGWGYGTQIDYEIWWKKLSWLKAIGASTGIVPPHNHLLSITYKMGIVGLLLFLFINIRIFFYGFFYIKNCKSDVHRRFLIAALAALLHWHGMAFFFDILESPPTGIFLWIILGGILAVIHSDKKNIASPCNG